jgi:hypothetical protein
MNLKWSDGLPYERTPRYSKYKYVEEKQCVEDKQLKHQNETLAISSSLNYDESSWEILNQSLSGNGFKTSNKREEIGNRLASREMVQQIGFNPFLETNYVEDVVNRDNFLKPMNTTRD